MGAKKKSKTNKLARMSEEEKLRYLQQRAAIEEEARRRKEQLISTFMKNKLKREDAFSRLNSAKINQQWRQTLRQIKNNELHEAAETLHQTFDVAIQTKNKIIETLLADLENSVSLHNLAVQTHLESINKIIEIEEERLDSLHGAYEAEREAKMKDAKSARTRGQLTYLQDKKQLDIDMYWQNHYHNKNEFRIATLAEAFRNDYKYKALSKTRREEEECSKKIEYLQSVIKETLRNYSKALSPFIAHYKQLREANMGDMKFHLQNMKIINVQYILIKKEENIRKAMDGLLKKTDQDFNKIINEKQQIFNTMRIRLKELQTDSKEALKHLSSASSNSIQYLELVSIKLKGIITLHKNCGKYFNEKEKFYLFHEYVSQQIESNEEYKDNEEITEKTRFFWKRHSEVVNEVTSLTAHHTSLMDDNISLKHSLMKYMKTLGKPSSLASCLYRDSNR